MMRIDVLEYFHIFRQNLRFIVTAWLVCGLVGWVWARTRPDVYLAVVELQAQAPRSSSGSEESLLSAANEKLAHPALARLIAEHNLYAAQQEADGIERAVAEMRRDISITLKQGDTFRLGYRAASPQLAQKIADQLALLYESLEEKERASKLKEAEAELARQEERWREFNTRFFGPQLEEQTSNLTTLNRLIMRLQSNASSLHELQQQELQQQRALVSLEPAGPSARNGNAENSAAVHLQGDGSRQSVPTPSFISSGSAVAPSDGTKLQGQIDLLSGQIQRHLKEQESIRREMSRYTARIGVVPKIREQQAAIAKDYEAAKQRYQSLLTEANEAKIGRNLTRESDSYQFRPLASATLPETPLDKGELSKASLASILGLLFGASVSVFRKPKAEGRRFEEELECRTGVPVLASVPFLHAEADGALENAKRRVRI